MVKIAGNNSHYLQDSGINLEVEKYCEKEIWIRNELTAIFSNLMEF